MVEVSDRPFGGVSNQAKISWTAEKFREALLEIADPETREQAMENLVGRRERGVDGKVGEVEMEVEEKVEGVREVEPVAQKGGRMKRSRRR